MWITPLIRLQTECLALSRHILHQAVHVPTCMFHPLLWRSRWPSPLRSCCHGPCGSIPRRPRHRSPGDAAVTLAESQADGKLPSAVEAAAVFPGGKGNQREVLSHPWVRSAGWWPRQLLQPQPLWFSRQQQVVLHGCAAEQKASIHRRSIWQKRTEWGRLQWC